MNLRKTHNILVLATALSLTSIAVVAQAPKADAQKAKSTAETKAPPKGKPLPFKGKIMAVGKDSVTVNHGDVPGFMPAMTMPYKVDKVDILKSVKVGDQVEATVYADDNTLYGLKVVPATSK